MAAAQTENQKYINQIVRNDYVTSSNLHTFYPNYSSQLAKLIQYKSIPYPHKIQVAKTQQLNVLAKLNHKKNQNFCSNSRIFQINQNYSTNRSQTASYLESEGNSRSQAKKNKNTNMISKIKNESFYEIQYENNQKRAYTSQKRYLLTNSSDFENHSIQGQEMNTSSDQLMNRNNQINSQSTITKFKNQLSFRDNLQNSYVSIESREDIALAKKLELIMGHSNQSYRSTKEKNKLLNKSQIIVFNNDKSRTNNNNISLETDQFKVSEQSQYDQQINLKTSKPLSSSINKQNSYHFDQELNQSVSKKEVFNFLKNKIFQKQVSQQVQKSNIQFRISKYSNRLDINSNFKNDYVNNSQSQFKYTPSPPPPQTADLIEKEKRVRITQSQGKRDKKRLNFYERFSEKLKQSIKMTELQQDYNLQQVEQGIQQQLNLYSNQSITHEKNEQTYLQMKYNPIQRGKKMFSSFENQLDLNKCEVLVAKYVNKSIFGDNYQSNNLKKYENQNKEKINNQIQTTDPNNIDLQQETQQQQVQKQQINYQNEQLPIQNIFYQGQQLKTNSSKKLQLISLNKNSTKKLLQETRNNSQNSQFDLKLNMEQEEQILQIQQQNYINFQNKVSFDQDDPDLREYLSENKISTQNLEVVGSDYN
ncbi:hypothetical protein ABPG72_002287 [Tetrahymena utriculariae]